MEFKISNMLGLLIMVGAIIMVLSIFLTWGTYEWFGTTTNYSGAQIYAAGIEDPEDCQYYQAVMVSVICGVIAMALMILPGLVQGEGAEKMLSIMGIIALILAIIALAYTVLMMTGNLFNDSGYDLKVGYGVYLDIVGEIILVLGGILPILQGQGILKIGKKE